MIGVLLKDLSTWLEARRRYSGERERLAFIAGARAARRGETVAVRVTRAESDAFVAGVRSVCPSAVLEEGGVA